MLDKWLLLFSLGLGKSALSVQETNLFIDGYHNYTRYLAFHADKTDSRYLAV